MIFFPLSSKQIIQITVNMYLILSLGIQDFKSTPASTKNMMERWQSVISTGSQKEGETWMFPRYFGVL